MPAINVHATNEFQKMQSAINAGDLKTVLDLLRDGFDLRCSVLKPEEKYTALHFAVARGRIDICRALLNAGADINAALKGGQRPLHLAAFQGVRGMCEFIVESGANAGLLDDDGRTPLHWWVSGFGLAEVCKVLVRAGCKIDHPDKKGNTALHGAIPHIVAFAAMIRAGANASFVPDDPPANYLTPFQRAVSQGAPDLVRALVKLRGEDLGQTTLDGRTLVRLANNRPEMKAVLMSLRTELAVRNALPDNGVTEVSRVSRRSIGMSPL